MLKRTQFYITCIILSVCFQAADAQQILTTKSGQKVLIAEDGSYKTVSSDAILDEYGNVTSSGETQVSVFEVPAEKTVQLTVTQQSEITSLTSQLKSKEIDLLLNILQQQKTIEGLESKSKLLEGDELTEHKVLISQKKKLISLDEKAYRKASKHLKSLAKLNQSFQKNADKKLNSIKEDIAEEFELTPTASATVAAQARMERKLPYPTKVEITKRKGPKDPYSCEITFDGTDPVTGKSKKEVKSGPLFSFTQEKLKPYFKEDNFLTCESILTKVGGNYFLTLNITIKSKDATRTYGFVKADEDAKIEFIDGDYIYMTNILQANGEIERYTGHTLYSIVYKIEKDELNMLENKLVDNIGLLWSSGYEKYDVYNVDFLQHQATCLKKGQ